MGTCLGKSSKGDEKAGKLRKKLGANSQQAGVTENTGTQVSTNQLIESTISKKDAPAGNVLTVTKGQSMALPGDVSRLPTTTEERAKLDSEAVKLDEALMELDVEENFDHPAYMKIDKKYKVGQPVSYPPALERNVVFNLADKSSDEDGSIQVTFAYKSLQGKTENRGASVDKPNQDSVAVIRSKDTPHRAIFGVFDGHGPFGDHASHFCRMELLKMYTIALREHGSETSQQILGHTLRYLDRKFANIDHKATKVDPIVSGTTAVLVMLDGNEIIAANVGDSRAILATKTENEIVIEPLTDDHKPERPDERERVEASSAILMNENQVRGRPNPATKDPKAPLVGKTYICRHTNGEIVYGVLFTRSIGDVDAHKHLGVSSEPEFITAKINDEVDIGKEQVIIIASDGVWDMMSNLEAAQICLEYMDPLAACDEIVKRCSDRWATSGEGRRDDITVCVVGLGVKFGELAKADDEEEKERGGSYYGLI